MATNAVVATGYIVPDSSTVDLTVSGFGTVTAALVVIGRAPHSSDPDIIEDAGLSVGLWTPSGVRSVSIFSNDAQGTTDCSYLMSTSLIGCHIGSNQASTRTFTCAAQTDGITITCATGTGSAGYHVWALLLSGTSNVYIGSQSLGTGTSALNITAPNFQPDLVLTLTSCKGTENSVGTDSMISFGAAHNHSTAGIRKAFAGLSSRDGNSITVVNSYVSSSYVGGQAYNDSLSWAVDISDFDSQGFSLTPTASAGSDLIYYLAIELANQDDAWVGVIDTKTGSTGTQAYSGVGFTPKAVGFVPTMVTALDTVTQTGMIGFGAMDGTRQDVSVYCDEDVSSAASDAESYSNAIALHTRTDGGTAEASATYSAFGSDGFTLNYSAYSSSARKVLAFAIGDSTAGGGAVSVSLTGQGVSTVLGGLSKAIEKSLSGQHSVVSLGTLGYTNTVAIVGNSVGVAQGSFVASSALQLNGQVATTTLGAFTPAVSIPVSGQAATVSQGIVTPATEGNVTLTLTGQQLTINLGTLNKQLTASLVGQGVSLQQGALIVSLSNSLNGQQSVVYQGGVFPVTEVTLSGRSVTVSQGTITPFVSGSGFSSTTIIWG